MELHVNLFQELRLFFAGLPYAASDIISVVLQTASPPGVSIAMAAVLNFVSQIIFKNYQENLTLK